VKRRDFLKIAGLTIAGSIIEPAIDLISGSVFGELPKAKKIKPKWVMAIDLKACSKKADCKDCIEACHTVHNIPDFKNPKDEVKWIWTAPFEKVFEELQHPFIKGDRKNSPVLVLCNQCEDPPCVKVCPTKATWKRRDGIVMMDYHRCIGCRYCMAACPYGARSFNWRDPRPFIKAINQDFPTRTQGIVEKCNFCEERLTKSLVPACVQACKEKALFFGNMKSDDSPVVRILKERQSVRRKSYLGTEPNIYYML